MVASAFPVIPLSLIVGPYDPSGASNLPADTVICAGLGAHAVSAITAIHVQDTSNTTGIQRLAPEFVDDQARTLLEDMAITAIKIGPQYDTETIATLAQLTADYSELPLVLHLATAPSIPDLDRLDPEETAAALLELLVPQASVIILDAGLPDQWAGQGLLSSAAAGDAIEALHEFGVPHILCSNAALGPGRQGLRLYTQGQGGRHWPWSWPALQVRASDGESLLATAVVSQLAAGKAAEAAIVDAVELARGRIQRVFHPGMGLGLLQHVSTP